MGRKKVQPASRRSPKAVERTDLSALISDEYRKLNLAMNSKHKWASANLGHLGPIVINTANEIEAESILDYGAGPRMLENGLNRSLRAGVVRSYDPGVEEISALPEPADLVVCNSVLEHIEIDKLEAVLDHLESLTKHTLICIISCYESGLLLDDGSTPHRTVQPANWWMPHLLKRWVFKRGDNNRQFFFRGLSKKVQDTVYLNVENKPHKIGEPQQ